MDLWIRSQNKKELIPNPKLGIDQCENRYYIVDRYNFENAFILGEYKSKERALEVLDEIENHLINSSFAKKTNGLGEVKDIIPNPLFVYEMPEE